MAGNLSEDIKKVEQIIENFVLKVERKLPVDIHNVCVKADDYISKALILLNNNPQVIDFMKLVPELETDREAIVGILKTLQAAFEAVADVTSQQALLNGAGSSIAATIHGQDADAIHYLIPYAVVRKSRQ